MKTVITFLLILAGAPAALSQGSAFTYQGKLTDAGSPASGSYDLSFRLFNAQSGGTQIGTDQEKDNVAVSGGIFTVVLDFGSSPFTSVSGNYLEISVRPGASTGAYTLLVPRQPITSSPYAVQTIRAESAAVADNANALGGTPAAQFTQNDDPRLSDARPPTAGSANYIQNGTGVQPLSNFNIGGNGTAAGTLSGGTVNAATQYKLAGDSVLRDGDGSNLFVGRNISTSASAFFNAMFGERSGQSLTTGANNAFFGQGSQTAPLSGTGLSTTTGSFNAFFGHRTGESNTTGNSNAFFGTGAGFFNVGGNENTFVGHDAGKSNSSGSFNTAIGTLANVAAANLSFATAVGSNALVYASDTVVLGKEAGIYSGSLRPADKVEVPGRLVVAGRMNALETLGIGIGLNAPSFRLHIRSDGQDGIKIQHSGTGAFPQLRWTDSSDAFKASIGVDTSGTGSMNFFVNGADRLVLQPNGVVRSPGGIFIASPNTLVITSPNGSCWGITVSDTGALATFSTPCP